MINTLQFAKYQRLLLVVCLYNLIESGYGGLFGKVEYGGFSVREVVFIVFYFNRAVSVGIQGVFLFFPVVYNQSRLAGYGIFGTLFVCRSGIAYDYEARLVLGIFMRVVCRQRRAIV